MKKRNRNTIYANYELVSEEEKQIAEYLYEKNLERVNSLAFNVAASKKAFYSTYLKRLIDLVISLSLCVILFPLFIFGFLGTWFTIGHPIIFKQTRMGKNLIPFVMYKFRSMTNTVDKNGKMIPMEKRVTSFGKLLRETSIDELPQLINIIRGDMSLIGPRALPMFYYERMSKKHKMRTLVKPGLECPFSFIPNLEGGDEEDYQFQIKYENDIKYVESISFKYDIKMLVLLIKLTFSKKDREIHAIQGTNFVGYDKKGRAVSLRIAKKYPERL